MVSGAEKAEGKGNGPDEVFLLLCASDSSPLTLMECDAWVYVCRMNFHTSASFLIPIPIPICLFVGRYLVNKLLDALLHGIRVVAIGIRRWREVQVEFLP
jgi:hypothetical protein